MDRTAPTYPARSSRTRNLDRSPLIPSVQDCLHRHGDREQSQHLLADEYERDRRRPLDGMALWQHQDPSNARDSSNTVEQRSNWGGRGREPVMVTNRARTLEDHGEEKL